MQKRWLDLRDSTRKLLHPIKHRSLEAHADLTVIRARAKLVELISA
jgi:hypothetical protein